MALIFPDNTVLINFAYCDEMDLLGKIVAGRGTWTASVASECDDNASVLGLPEMIASHTIFGEPLRPDRVEHIQTLIHRDHFKKPGDGPKKHLGESEALAIIENRRFGETTVFVTDDGDVPKRAKSCSIPVSCITTWDLVRFGVLAGHADEVTALSMRDTLMNLERVHLTHVRDRHAFIAWLRERTSS